jgi:CHAD domain-containing protein
MGAFYIGGTMQATLLSPARDSAKRTVQSLIRTHEEALRAIAAGAHYIRHGEDITPGLIHRIQFEIEQCRMVLEALEHMKAGDAKRAADLCEQIQEHILNVH